MLAPLATSGMRMLEVKRLLLLNRMHPHVGADHMLRMLLALDKSLRGLHIFWIVLP